MTGFGNYLNLVTPGDGYLWPALIIVAAILCAPLYVLGLRFCIRLRLKRNFSAEESLRLNKDLFAHIIFCVASIFLTTFINAASIVHSSTFYSRIQNGLLEAMENYVSDVVAKVRIDSVQIEFHCCGSNSYKDWFFIPWKKLGAQSTEKIERIEDADEKGDENEFLADDVPFSCCLKDILGPCVHHNIMAGSDAYLYDSNDKVSIATAGCHSKMLSTATLVGNLIVLVLFFLSVYQLVLSLLLRLLQTAHSNTFYIGPRKSHYVAWIFGSMPLQENSDKLTDEEEAFLEEDVDEPSKDCAPFPQPSSFPQEMLSSITLNGHKNTRAQLLRRICSKLSLKLAAANRDGHRLLSSLGIAGEKQKKIQEKVEEAEGMTSEEDEWMSPLKKITTAAPPLPSLDFSPEITSTGKILETCCTSEYSDRVSINRLKGGGPSQPTNRSNRSDASESSRTRLRESDEGRHSQSGSKISTLSRFVPCKVQLLNTQETEHETNVLYYPGKFSSAGRSWLRSPGSQINSDSEHESQLSKYHRKLDTDYNRSIFIKRRGAFNKKENECQQPRQDSWGERQSILRAKINNPGCRVSPKFNPSDAYNRFRGSIQDTIRRRENQMQARRINLISDLNRSNRQSRRNCMVNNCQHMSKLGLMIHHPVSQVQHSSMKTSQIYFPSPPPPPPPPLPPLPTPHLRTSIPTVKRIPWASTYRESSGSPSHWMTMNSVRHTSFSRPAFPQPP
ncbi:uncharacterized protein LOC107265747 isoform X2 [Cephus cinctus]|nr:uncharacterized protein LOC107265747 isoform X2 [Cephus cinctus]